MKLKFHQGLICSHLSSSTQVKTHLIRFEAKWKPVRPPFPSVPSSLCEGCSGPWSACRHTGRSRNSFASFYIRPFSGAVRNGMGFWTQTYSTSSHVCNQHCVHCLACANVDTLIRIKWAVNILRTSGYLPSLKRREEFTLQSSKNRDTLSCLHLPYSHIRDFMPAPYTILFLPHFKIEERERMWAGCVPATISMILKMNIFSFFIISKIGMYLTIGTKTHSLPTF